MDQKVIDETGGLYNPTTGEFSIPVKGRYQFTLTFVSDNHGDPFKNEYAISLRIDGKDTDVLYSSSIAGGNRLKNSNTLISNMDLDAGQVAVFYISSMHTYTHIMQGTFFEGKLVKRH